MPAPILADLTAANWITAAAIAVATLLISIIIRRLTKRRIRKKDREAELIDVGGRLIVVIVVALGAFYMLQALEIEIGPLLGALGVGALFIAVGLQPLLINFVGSVILQTRRPFIRGDQIQTVGFEGTVIDISSTSTVLLSYDGEAIHVPNGEVLAHPLINWTHEPMRRTVMELSVPYGCELPKVIATIGRAARRILDDENLPPAEALATGFGAHGIDISLRFWHYSDRLESQVARSQVTVAVDAALREIGVEIPYNQMVVHSAPPAPPTPAPADPTTGTGS